MSILQTIKGPTGTPGYTTEAYLVRKSIDLPSIAIGASAVNVALDAGDAPVGSKAVYVSGLVDDDLFITGIADVTTADTLPCRFVNTGAGAIDPAAANLTFLVIKP